MIDYLLAMYVVTAVIVSMFMVWFLDKRNGEPITPATSVLASAVCGIIWPLTLVAVAIEYAIDRINFSKTETGN